MSLRSSFKMGLCLLAVLFFSCRSHHHQISETPRELRERATAKRAHASGLRTDVVDLDHMIAGSAEAQRRLQDRLSRLDGQIEDLQDKVDDLTAEQAQLPPYEAYIREKTVRRWKTSLDTIRHQRDRIWNEVRELQRQMKEQKSVQETYRREAETMRERAEELDRRAQKLEGKEPVPPEDFWSQW